MGFAEISAQHSVADKAVADARQSGYFANFLRQFHHRCQYIVSGFFTTHHFQQFHYIGRTEEMHAEHILRPGCNRGDGIDILVRSIRSQNGARLAHGIQFAEDLNLDLGVFKNGLDHEVNLAQVIIGSCATDQAHEFLDLLQRETTLRRRALVVFPANADSTVQRFLVQLEQDNRNAGIGKIHRNSTAHGAGTNDSHRIYRSQRCVPVDIFDFCCLAFGKKHMPQSSRFG